jgi:hypothetical protein
MWNPHRGGRDEHKGHNLSPEGPGSKAFGGTMRDAHFPRHFWAPGNVVKYDDKTNPSVWLEDYYLTCRAGGANGDLFIIQFLPIYLVDFARSWLDNLPRNIIDSWDNLREIFTGNFHSTCILATLGIWRADNKSQAYPSEIASNASHKSVTSSLVSLMPMSSRCFGMARWRTGEGDQRGWMRVN